mgnify:CR=1 FL=1
MQSTIPRGRPDTQKSHADAAERARCPKLLALAGAFRDVRACMADFPLGSDEGVSIGVGSQVLLGVDSSTRAFVTRVEQPVVSPGDQDDALQGYGPTQRMDKPAAKRTTPVASRPLKSDPVLRMGIISAGMPASDDPLVIYEPLDSAEEASLAQEEVFARM